MNCARPTHYELRFRSLFRNGRGYAFPCDEQGHVDLDALSEQARDNYLYARAVIGREFTLPVVEACEEDSTGPADRALH